MLRFEGASLLVVKGERNLRTCGLLEHNNEKELENIFLPGANRQVKVIYESNAQETAFKELIEPININDTHKSSTNISLNNFLEKDFQVHINNNTDNSTQKRNATTDERYLEMLYHTAASYIQKHKGNQTTGLNIRKLRRARNRRHTMKNKRYRINRIKEARVQRLKRELLFSYDTDADVSAMKPRDGLRNRRFKRSQKLMKPPSLLDRGIRHGGNADKNTFEFNDESSVSSFERGLFNCYGGAILLTHEFEPSDQCTNISYLINGKHMQASHRVEEDGYYYYIFYSDNDIVFNDIYALFDIYKPTFQYENVTKSCINQTECSFSLTPMSLDRVIVEIPTEDGIEHDEMDNTNILISVCRPRTGVYIIFPIAVLFIILGCAFI